MASESMELLNTDATVSDKEKSSKPCKPSDPILDLKEAAEREKRMILDGYTNTESIVPER